MKLKTIQQILDETLCPQLAEAWDNVGLLIGDPADDISRILLCIDLTPAVLQEAVSKKANMILAYHPPIFEPLKTIRLDRQQVIYKAVQSGIAVYAIHTALDVIAGGTSDALADLIDLENRKPIERIHSPQRKSKLVVFVPYEAQHLEKVSLAMFGAGGGQIGKYSCCSFLTAGHGTFRGDMTTHPAIGKPGKFESVQEMRIEVVVDNENLPKVIAAMKAVHPYEQPAYDIYPLANEETNGSGKIGNLRKSTSLKTITDKIKKRTGLDFVQIADCGKKNLQSAAVGPGSCGKMLDELAGKIDLFVTGEIRHHTALAAIEKGTSVICLGHGNSERIALAPLSKTLQKKLPQMKFIVSQKDIDPLTMI